MAFFSRSSKEHLKELDSLSSEERERMLNSPIRIRPVQRLPMPWYKETVFFDQEIMDGMTGPKFKAKTWIKFRTSKFKLRYEIEFDIPYDALVFDTKRNLLLLRQETMLKGVERVLRRDIINKYEKQNWAADISSMYRS